MAAGHHVTIYFLLLQSDGMVRSLPNMTQVDMSVNMLLLEGVRFRFSHLFYAHTHVIFC